MSKVSTRTQKSATPVTAAVTAVADPTTWQHLAAESRGTALALVESAKAIEDQNETVEVFWRLTSLAANMLEVQLIGPADAKKADVEWLFGDVMALVTGALNAPDEEPSAHSRKLLTMAQDVLLVVINAEERRSALRERWHSAVAVRRKAIRSEDGDRSERCSA